MSTYTTIVIEAAHADLLPPDEATLCALLGDADTVTDQTTDEPARWVWETENRWTLDGIQARAVLLSDNFGGATVEVVEEWDTRDADEQGSQGWRYRGGALLATGATEMVWKQVQA